jgi:hypothetical protein
MRFPLSATDVTGAGAALGGTVNVVDCAAGLRHSLPVQSALQRLDCACASLFGEPSR